jgi:hypothetical protein
MHGDFSVGRDEIGVLSGETGRPKPRMAYSVTISV